ncbi:hypothetical protein EGR_10766 [Echinococcus granulosus]|uniref:C2H2-type domain-containing protein n=1 Tax=Echinococcus granulosus TaxID=6210 RepID=W6ULF6_ECHGR|nr:hypothetical protein EGR_10766 [Echinococcus granulosus]EUB54369.1 hypothetical protein EGR_10766 [Echinococcus granulosus]
MYQFRRAVTGIGNAAKMGWRDYELAVHCTFHSHRNNLENRKLVMDVTLKYLLAIMDARNLLHMGRYKSDELQQMCHTVDEEILFLIKYSILSPHCGVKSNSYATAVLLCALQCYSAFTLFVLANKEYEAILFMIICGGGIYFLDLKILEKTPFTCQYCSTSFLRQGSLNLHISEVHEVQALTLSYYVVLVSPISAFVRWLYYCKYCNESFSQWSYMNRHITVKHGRNLENF